MAERLYSRKISVKLGYRKNTKHLQRIDGTIKQKPSCVPLVSELLIAANCLIRVKIAVLINEGEKSFIQYAFVNCIGLKGVKNLLKICFSSQHTVLSRKFCSRLGLLFDG